MSYVGAPDWQNISQPQGDLDLIATFTTGAGTVFTGFCGAVLGAYQYILVEVPNDGSPALITSDLYGISGNASVHLSRYTDGTSICQFFHPVMNAIGDTPEIYLTADPTFGALITISVYGVRYYPPGMRSDGNYPCQNSLQATWNAATGTTTVVAAPASPQRLLVGAVICPAVTIAAAARYVLLGKQGGAAATLATVLLSAGAVGSYSGLHSGPGILLDPGTAITQEGNAAPASQFGGTVFYDIVTA